MSTYTDPEHFSSVGWLTSASAVPKIGKSSACASFLNLGGLASAAAGAATSAAGPLGGAVGGLTGGLGGKAGSSQSVLTPEPKAEDPRDRFKLMLEFKRTGYPDDHYPQPDAGSPGQLAFAALHWSRHEVANALRAMESMRFVEQQAQVAKAIADKAAIQLTYLMESPYMLFETGDHFSHYGSQASTPPDLQRGRLSMTGRKASTFCEAQAKVAESDMPVLSMGFMPTALVSGLPALAQRPPLLGPTAAMGCIPHFPVQGTQTQMAPMLPGMMGPPHAAMQSAQPSFSSQPRSLGCTGCGACSSQALGAQPMVGINTGPMAPAHLHGAMGVPIGGANDVQICARHGTMMGLLQACRHCVGLGALDAWTFMAGHSGNATGRGEHQSKPTWVV
ncbi:unnamed protein product [Symbiodinium sp. CCMP2592]|nr:unnamed protein product [Symbiodinium sp. CCMP2592]